MRFFNRIATALPGARTLYRCLVNLSHGGLSEVYPRGHCHSPLPDIAKTRSQADVLFRKDVQLDPSLDLREESQMALLEELAVFYEDVDWPKQSSPKHRYYYDNASFGLGSAFSLSAMMRRFQPRQVIEVGSGFSSAVMLDTNDRFFDGSIALTFIEPCPVRLFSLLRPNDRRDCRIIQDVVQDVPMSTFEALQRGDFLFIDSSHVSKIGSDVNFIFFKILPSLRSGVLVHIHDVHWPFEYPESWITGGIAWNEGYLLRAFLQYNDRFEILQFNNFLAYRFQGFFEQHLSRIATDPGSSFWMRKR